MQPANFIDDRFGCRRIACLEADAALWLVDVSEGAAAHGDATLALSGEEIERAGRLRRPDDRARFMRTRSALRHLLGEATGREARALAFSSGPFGKPVLAGAPAPHFNVSHSGALALIGISPLSEIGVDIERVTGNIDELDLAAAFFSAGEHRFLKSLDAEARLAAFYAIWTCKESVLKAFGVGITVHLKGFEVRLGREGVSMRPEPGCFTPALTAVRLASVEVPPGYAAACAFV